MRRGYEVDWFDGAYPRIVGCPPGEEGKTLEECRREIKRSAKSQVEHWQKVAREARRGLKMWSDRETT